MIETQEGIKRKDSVIHLDSTDIVDLYKLEQLLGAESNSPGPGIELLLLCVLWLCIVNCTQFQELHAHSA